MGIRESLGGKRILLTGVTGFLGTAVLERLLVDVPVERLDVVIRGNAESRLKGILSGSAFRPAVESMGKEAFEAMASGKVRAIATDLSEGAPPVAGDIDLVIHTAATVSFDPPIDEAFRTNLLGTLGLYEAAAGRPFLHVSTAYVAGLTRGTLPEELLARRCDWRVESAAAARMRETAEDESRHPSNLRRLESRARGDRGRVGPQAVARRTEDLRKDWVKARLVEQGRARARSLGWPDVYTFTKALTEMALDECAGDSPLTVVRPSIIESALERPFPGWIEGFRMADPLILAFGRGMIPEFPGIPEGLLDVIPVDLVVNAILAAAAKPERRAVYQVCSGNRNPLRFREMYDLTRSYFQADPLPKAGRGAYGVPSWKFPGSRTVNRRIDLAEKALTGAERLVARLPRNGFARGSARRLDDLRGQLDYVRRYAELYGDYVEAEVIHLDARTKELFEGLSDDDRRDFPFDPASFTWKGYLHDIHMPAVTSSVRRVTSPRRPPALSLVGSGEKLVLAVFDIEGTVIESNVLEPYLWLRMAERDLPGRAREVAALALKAPSFLAAERRDRGEFLRMFYRLYEGAPVEGVRRLAHEILGPLVLRRVAPAAVRRVREHKAAGHRVIFVTASLEMLVQDLASLADELVTASLAEKGGFFTGDMDRPPLVGEARAAWLRDYAAATGADLSASYGYADSMSDLALLEAVGKAVAVNPEIGLARIARLRRWPIEEWEHDRGTPRILLPELSQPHGAAR